MLEGGSYVLTGQLVAGTGADRPFVDGFSLTADQPLNYDVASSGDVDVIAGAGDDALRASSDHGILTLVGYGGEDTLIGGDGDVILYGGIDADRIEMNGPGNIAQYNALDSSAKAYDTIVNFAASGGRIELLFDSGTATTGTQHDFHFEKTADRTGNILFKYDAGLDETVVKVFTDADHKADMVVHLTGDVPLTPTDFVFGWTRAVARAAQPGEDARTGGMRHEPVIRSPSHALGRERAVRRRAPRRDPLRHAGR